MKKTDETSLQVAKLLLEIKAVKLSPDQPFRWASGWNSPIYCDNRISLSYPKVRTFIRQQLANVIGARLGEVDIIAGVATAGIPQGALVAEALGLPFIYVRSSAKEHGMGNQIEGVVQPGARVVLIEDLISTGGSSLKAAEAVKAAGMQVRAIVSVFTYGFPLAEANFKAAKVESISLTDYSTLLQVAQENNYIAESDLQKLNAWRETPESWTA
ncbi:MAG: orotate phosphoribosyltransferase [Sphingobacteriaceae bacterium]|nr:orotate phosphoribosyltransferase [Sphingobacteriaceae bacterium]